MIRQQTKNITLKMLKQKPNLTFWFFIAMSRVCRCHEINTMINPNEDSKLVMQPIDYLSPRRIRKRFVVFDTDKQPSNNQDATTDMAVRNEWNENRHHNHSDFHGNHSRGSKLHDNTKHREQKFAKKRTLTMAKEEMNRQKEDKNRHMKGSELDYEVLEYVIMKNNLQNSFPSLLVPTNRPSSSAHLPTATPVVGTNTPTLMLTSSEPTVSVDTTPTANPEFYETEEPTSITPTILEPSLEPYTDEPSSSDYATIKPTISHIDDNTFIPTSSPTSDTKKGNTESPTSPLTTEATDANTAVPTFSPTPFSLSFFPTYGGTYSPTFSTYYPTYGTYVPTLDGTHAPTSRQFDNLWSPNRICPSNLARSEGLRDDLTLYYEVIRYVEDSSTNGGVFCVKLEYDAEGWLGFGFSSGGEMIGSTAVIGLPNDEDSTSNPGKYGLDGKTESLVVVMDAAHQTLRDATIRQDNGITIMEFGKLLIEDDEEPLVVPGENTFIYSASTSNELGYHGLKRGSIILYLE